MSDRCPLLRRPMTMQFVLGGGYSTIKELYNALKFITMLCFILNILRFNLGVAFLTSESIHSHHSIGKYPHFSGIIISSMSKYLYCNLLI